MVCRPGIMAQIIRDGMDEYWKAVYSPTDDGLDAIELQWKRQHKADLVRLEKKIGADFDRIFGKAKQD